ncbi:MAG: T9SS type A sorting domain-containing protein [Bacteroidetes bacterium]|nr:T9SS type A sorting domain-containing protein [Bacteroidota bacterium]
MEQYYKQNDSSRYNVLAEVKQMPDGGFIATGTCRDSLTNFQGIWLLRTDSNGCLVPGCFPTSIQIFPDELMHVSIYPNPTGGSFTIDYSKPLGENCDIRVFDITGKIIYLQSEIAGSFKTIVNLQAAAGIYLLQIISTSGESIYTQKIQVE